MNKKERYDEWQQQYHSVVTRAANPYAFLAYNAQDAEKVSPVAQALDKANVRMWPDKGLDKRLTYDMEWQAQIAEHIQCAQVMLLFVSRSTFSADDSLAHLAYQIAQLYGKKIVPILLEQVERRDVSSSKMRWFIELQQFACIYTYRACL